MLVLLSPSKTQDFHSNTQIQKYTIPVFLKEAQSIQKELKKLSLTEIEEQIKVSTKLAEKTAIMFDSFSESLNLENAKQALLVFTGHVFEQIDVHNYKEKDFQFAQKHLRIFSALYGVLRPLDLIQMYRLDYDMKFKFQGEDLMKYWKEKCTENIKKTLQENKEKHIINLASQEYFNSINFSKITKEVKEIDIKIINIVFKEKKNEKYKIVSIFAKRARGLMCDFIIKNQITSPEKLKTFNTNNYTFKSELSSENEFIFTRES